MTLRALHHTTIPHPRRSLLVLLLATACSQGRFSGEVLNPDMAAPGGDVPAPTHEDVAFRWRSDAGSRTGQIDTTLPGGEKFGGRFHAITTATQVADVNDFHATWYGDPWRDSSWLWGDTWPRLGSVEEFIINYTGKVVAILTSREGTKMRCRFKLDDVDRGMTGGGSGECQLSNGERLTAKLLPK